MNGQYQAGDVVLENWTLTRPIGEGSYGKVFEAERVDFGETYRAAIKIIVIPRSKDEISSAVTEGMTLESVSEYFKSFVEEIAQEFALMAKLKGNSSIVSYEDHEVIPHTDGIGWDVIIRMELLTPLLDILKDKDLPYSEVIRLGIDMCEALELCRKNHIIHRDIKPENIFRADTGEYKLGDFGIARTIDKTNGGMSKKGTYTYMAPEVYREEPYNATVDIYSLGIVLYRLLNDKRTPFLPAFPAPIRHSDREAALAKRLNGEQIPPPAHDFNGLSRVVLKACSYNPEDRYQTPQDLKLALEACLNGNSVEENSPLSSLASGTKGESVTEPTDTSVSLQSTPKAKVTGKQKDQKKQTQERNKKSPLLSIVPVLVVLMMGVLFLVKHFGSSPEYSALSPALTSSLPSPVPASPSPLPTSPSLAPTSPSLAPMSPSPAPMSPSPAMVSPSPIVSSLQTPDLSKYEEENFIPEPVQELHIHEWVEATCTEPRTCTLCGETEGEPNGHKWIMATEDSPQTCSLCGETQGAPLGHDWGEPIYTWSADYSKVTAERICKTNSDHIEKEEVNTSGTVSRQATCEEAGETVYTTARFKNNVFTQQSRCVDNLPATGHSWNEATCTEPRTCKLCGKKEGTPLGHQPETENAVEPTCLTDGLTEGSYCLRCGVELVEQEVLKALGHSWVSATCTEAMTCSRCGETRGISLGHDIVNDPAVAASCTTSGLTKGSHCRRCGEIIQAQKKVPELGHVVMTDKAIAPSCTETGLTEGSHCTRCGELFVAQEKIPALGHDDVIDKAVGATCTTSGLTEGSHCERCKMILAAQKVVPALGHDIIKDEAVGATCTEAGLTEGSHCSRCGEIIVKQETVRALGHDWQEATDTSPKICKRCGLTQGEPLKQQAFTENAVYYSVSKPVQGTDVSFRNGKQLTTGSYAKLSAGDYVLFGSYEQDGDSSDGKEEIEWLVLEVKGSEVLLISRYGIEAECYHDPDKGKLESTTWRSSTLRAWLNRENGDGFLNGAFTEKEINRILITEVAAESNSFYQSDAGTDTKDKVFLLSLNEAKKYLKTDAARRCRATASAAASFSDSEKESSQWWWLRTPGASNESASCVKPDGSVDTSGAYRNVNNSQILVRPVIRVTLNDENEIAVKSRASSGTDYIKRIIPVLFPGDTITFGTYNKNSLEWLVLKAQKEQLLLITKDSVDIQSFYSRSKETTWRECKLRSWLNESFISDTFTYTEQSRLLAVDVSADANPAYSTDPGKASKDRVFLLSTEEAEKYFSSDENRKCAGTAWWLRTPGAEGTKAALVSADGSIDYAGKDVGETSGVRPALWMNLTF